MKEKAKQFVEDCRRKGWHVYMPQDRAIITIGKNIKKDDLEAYSIADSEYFSLISHVPRTSPGSDWGTTGDGVGGLSAMKRGEYVLNRSGVSIRFLTAVRKYLIEHPDLNIEI